MSAFPQGLTEHFGNGVTTLCHCWKVTRTDGVAIGFTDHDRVLLVGGTMFEPQTGLSASEARETLGLAVDTVDVEGALSSDRISDADVANGLYDRATVETFLVNWRKPSDFALLRTATIGRITRRDNAFQAELESPTHALDQVSGRYVSRACDAELGDGRCRVLLSQFGASGTVIAPHGTDVFSVVGLEGFAAGWFSHGVLKWADGRAESIVDHRIGAEGVLLTLKARSGRAVVPGEVFSIVAGCDKTFAACKAKFSNALNFQGFPHLPGNDAAYSYVTDGGVFDGGALVP
ncbi:DUF2163 domain-containing protein [Mesorhizobium sp. SB112]|uniref:DUF2163 domain-containing protein n=1 Tax=Mesorhizobium sp. SB112 TaxID=3151853 RepID=UPI003265CBF8